MPLIDLSDKNVPEGFIFPAKYLEFMASDPHPILGPWWFLCEYPKYADFWLNQMQTQYPSRQLVPFAKMENTDDLACFDASIKTDDPIVFYVHANASPGWEDRGHVKNFEEWLRAETERYADWSEDDGVYPC